MLLNVWSRPAEGHLRRCLVVRRHRARERRLKRLERARAVGRGEAPQGEELRSDAALSPGRHSPGELRVPRLPGSGTFQGVPPALAEASSVPSSMSGWVRAETRLRLPTRGAEARGQGSRRCRARGVRVRVALGTWPWALALPSAASHAADGPLPPAGPKPARRILRRGPVPAHPALAPLVFFRGSRTSRPSCLGPGEGREKEDACPRP